MHHKRNHPFQNWSEAFTGEPDLREVDKLYKDLKSKGHDFPVSDPEMSRNVRI